MQFYPISLDEIKAKVEKNFRRRNGFLEKNRLSLFPEVEVDNVKEIINEFGEKIVRVDGEIPVDLSANNGDRFLFISYSQSIYSHGLHKYPAKFFPELPRWLIKRYSQLNDLVLDPFAGSGTTNIEALLCGRHSVGVDVDPFSRFLATVKTTNLDETELKRTQKSILRSIVNYQSHKVKESDIPKFPYRDNWFKKEILLELAYIKKSIESLETESNIKNFFLVCLSSIVRSVSNADDNCTRTVIRKKLNKQVLPADALKRFAEVVLRNTPKMIDFSQSNTKNASVIFPKDMDARHIKYKDDVFDLAVTSPPYANAVDYPRTHQLESYWLGLAEGSLNPLKKIQVGTESVKHSEYKSLQSIGFTTADNVLAKIFKKDPRRSYIAFKYLLDMQKNFAEVHRVLKPDARYVVVVGNNKIRGELFENWKYLMEIAEHTGFSIENYFGSEIIKHFIKVPREERINTDWVLVLRKYKGEYA